ncbi:DinB family protein [Bacillus sp. FSL W8-0102]|uniref:DinB family protein n=1 Tax=Bacillus sp. FSL W8-0102 TaxID=2978205 RepID=UPI0040402940
MRRLSHEISTSRRCPRFDAYELPDSLQTDPTVSITLLKAVHSRWVDLLLSMDEKDFSRCFIHPENGKMDLNQALALYAWHSKHHLAHITSLLDRMDWKK